MKLSLSSIARLLVVLYSLSPIFGIPLWISWLQLDGELPPLIASHWGFDGVADGFMTPDTYGWSIAAVLGLLWLLMVWLLWTRRLPNLTRWVVVAPLLLVYLGLVNLVIDSVLMQRGLTDVSAVQVPFGSLVLLFIALPLILAFTLWMPKVSIREGRLEAATWAIPIYRVSLSEVTSIEPVQLRARDFGGLGFRFGRGGFAIIPRPGQGVRITHESGLRVSVRCDNASQIIESFQKRESN